MSYGTFIFGAQGALILCAGTFALFSSCQSSDYLQEAPPVIEPKAAVVRDISHKIVELGGSLDVDLLWVIDNSFSMEDHQESVARNMDAFMNVLVNERIHWQMGMISTDDTDSPYLGFTAGAAFDWKSPNPVPLFSEAVSRLGLDGAGWERMFSPVMKALEDNPHFLRPGVPLSIIVITDAPEQSSVSSYDFLQFLTNRMGNLKSTVIYGVLGASEFCEISTDDEWSYHPASSYKAVIEGTEGKVWSLCSDFGVSLTEIAEDVVQRIVRPKIYLEERPDISTLKVYYKDQELPGGLKDAGGYWLYDYDLSSIVFWDLEFAPGDDESVRVVYQAL